MKSKLTKILSVVLCMAGSSAWAGDVEDLIAADEEAIAKFNAGDPSWADVHVDGEGLGYSYKYPLLAVSSGADVRAYAAAGTAAAKAAAEGEFTPTFTMEKTNREVRVHGDTGVMASFVHREGCRTLYNCFADTYRQMTTWTKVKGEWKIMGSHASWFPKGDEY